MTISFCAPFTSGLPYSSTGIRTHDIYSDRNFFCSYKDFTIFFYAYFSSLQTNTYPVVMEFHGVGRILGPQIMAEVGDVLRFKKKESLVCFAGLEAPPYESGKFESHNRTISKKGSPHLRAALFQVMDCLLKTQPVNDPVFQFIDRKRFIQYPPIQILNHLFFRQAYIHHRKRQLCHRQNSKCPARLHPTTVKMTVADDSKTYCGNDTASEHNLTILFPFHY